MKQIKRTKITVKQLESMEMYMDAAQRYHKEYYELIEENLYNEAFEKFCWYRARINAMLEILLIDTITLIFLEVDRTEANDFKIYLSAYIDGVKTTVTLTQLFSIK
jgi:hypothetical protein